MTTYIVVLLNDQRECSFLNGIYTHVLHSGWQISEHDRRIIKVTPA